VHLAVTACSSTLPTYLDNPERNLGVNTAWYGSDLRIYHSALLDPQGLALRSPGYIVGVENIHPSSAAPAEVKGVALPRREGHVITHIVRHEKQPGTNPSKPMTSCVLFTMLDRDDPKSNSPDPDHHLFERCPPKGGPAHDNGANPLALLRDRLVADLRSENYSHIMIMVMGWNTDQEKALKNFNSIAGHLSDEEAGEGFHPLIIGVTWPSQWQLGEWSIVPDAVVRGLSFTNKAHDAEDVGKSVLQPLIQAVLDARKIRNQPGAAQPTRLVLLGHSFGARALVSAMTQRSETQEAAGESRFNAEDRLILLEGAFEMRHLFDEQGNLRSQFARGAPRVTMTASANDSAVSAAIWGWYAGDIDTFNHVCRTNAVRFGNLDIRDVGCAVAIREPPHEYGLNLCVETAVASVPRPLEGKPVRYFDAGHLINCQQPFTGGGAHSDIFRRETARFLMDEVN